MWSLPIVVLVCLAAVAAGSPMCAVEPFLKPLYYFYNPKATRPHQVRTDKHYLELELSVYGTKYENKGFMGMVIPSGPGGCDREDIEKIEKICGPLSTDPNSGQFKLFLNKEPCAVDYQLAYDSVSKSYIRLYDIEGSRPNTDVIGRVYAPAYSTVPAYCPSVKEIATNMTVPLFRFYSGQFNKHVQHTDPNYPKLFYGDDARYFTTQNHTLGKVLPNEKYVELKDAIDYRCPHLKVYRSVRTPTTDDHAKTHYDQKLVEQGIPLNSTQIDQGPLFLAAKEKGYCGADKPLYFTDSNRPINNDWFYIENATFYQGVLEHNDWYNGPNNKRGIAFYIW